MTSIVILLLFTGGIIPAYAQTITPMDATGVQRYFFWDFINPPACNLDDAIYARGNGLTPLTLPDIVLTKYPENGNADGAFVPGSGIITDYSDAVEAANGFNPDGNGDAAPTYVHDQLEPGDYNLIVDYAADTDFLPGTDVVDALDNYGLVVFRCEDIVPAIIKVTQGKTTESPFQANISTHITVSSFPIPIIEDIIVYILPDQSVNMRTSTINNLSEKSVFSSNVSITADGEFDREITWSNPTPGTYNIILDLNNDDTYTPYVDIIDNIDSYGFTVSVPSPTNITPVCVGGNDDSYPWWIVFIPFGPIIELVYDQPFNQVVYACVDNTKFASSVIVGDFNGDGYDDLAVGAPGEDVDSNSAAGAVSIIYSYIDEFSPAAQLYNQDSTGIKGTAEADDRFGSSLAVGDFNGDGIDDLAIGVPGEDIDDNSEDDAGLVNIIYGSSNGLTSP